VHAQFHWRELKKFTSLPKKDRSRGIYFTQDWCGLGGTMPVASGGILRVEF